MLTASLRFRSSKDHPKPETPESKPTPVVEQDSPIYQTIKSPPQPVKPNPDPFGTMRASQRRQKSKSQADKDDDCNDDVFLPNLNNNNFGEDPFGTLRANKAMNNNKKDVVDYRDNKSLPVGNGSNGFEEELAITNELLNLLDDFRTKNYTVKKMELMFDHWRRKASIYEISEKSKSKDFEDVREKLKKYTSNSAFVKLFRNSSSKSESKSSDQKHEQSSKEALINSPNFDHTHGVPVPKIANESIIEGKIDDILKFGVVKNIF